MLTMMSCMNATGGACGGVRVGARVGASQCKSSMNYLWILLEMTHYGRGDVAFKNEFSADRNTDSTATKVRTS